MTKEYKICYTLSTEREEEMSTISTQQLYIEYVTNNKTIEEISKEYNMSEKQIYALIRFNGFIELKRKRWGIIRKSKCYFDTNPEWFNKPGDIPA